MQSENLRGLSTPRRGSAFRTIIIMGTLVPAWHSMGMDLFNKTSSRTLSTPSQFSRKALPSCRSIPMDFTATAYCGNGITKSGVQTAFGIVAADPKVLPLGSWIQIECPAEYRGTYRVMDTGRLIKGKRIDIYIPTLKHAARFGRQKVQVSIVQLAPFKIRPVLPMN